MDFSDFPSLSLLFFLPTFLLLFFSSFLLFFLLLLFTILLDTCLSLFSSSVSYDIELSFLGGRFVIYGVLG